MKTQHTIYESVINNVQYYGVQERADGDRFGNMLFSTRQEAEGHLKYLLDRIAHEQEFNARLATKKDAEEKARAIREERLESFLASISATLQRGKARKHLRQIANCDGRIAPRHVIVEEYNGRGVFNSKTMNAYLDFLQKSEAA